MNSQQLLYANIVIGILFVAYFLFGRGKQRQPTQLNVKAKEDFKKNQPKTDQIEAALARHQSFQQTKTVQVLEPEIEIQNIVQLKDHKARNLSIYFVYNGHEWESHEVLGVPQGAPLPAVTEAYQILIKTSDPSTFEFFESAYHSILKRWRDRL